MWRAISFNGPGRVSIFSARRAFLPGARCHDPCACLEDNAPVLNVECAQVGEALSDQCGTPGPRLVAFSHETKIESKTI